PGADNDIETFLRRDIERARHVADAGEVVHALRRGMVSPVDIDADGVVAARPHLLQHVAPEAWARQPVGMEFARPDEDAPAVDLERAGVPCDGVLRRMRLRLRGGKRARAQQSCEAGDEPAKTNAVHAHQSIWNTS